MDKYFLSNAHKILFALNHTDGEIQMKLLDINYQCFSSKKKAKQWHDDIIVELEQVGASQKEFEKVQRLYNDMI